jgi:hypothetical protein
VKVGEKRPLETEPEVKKEEVAAAAPDAEAEKKETEEPEAKKTKVKEDVAAPEAASTEVSQASASKQDEDTSEHKLDRYKKMVKVVHDESFSSVDHETDIAGLKRKHIYFTVFTIH